MPWVNGSWVNEDPFSMGSPNQGGILPQSQATTSSNPAELARHMAGGGAFNTIYDPNKAGGDTGYNPAQYASDPFTQALAGNLGANRVTTNNIASPAGNVPSQNMLDFGGNQVLNAGLVGQNFARYGPQAASQMLRDELRYVSPLGGGVGSSQVAFNEPLKQGNTSFIPGMQLGQQFGGSEVKPEQITQNVQRPTVAQSRNPMGNPNAFGMPNFGGGWGNFGGNPFQMFGGFNPFQFAGMNPFQFGSSNYFNPQQMFGGGFQGFNPGMGGLSGFNPGNVPQIMNNINNTQRRPVFQGGFSRMNNSIPRNNLYGSA